MDANTLEATLKNQQWVGGDMPSDADTAAFESMKTANLSPATHPHAFAWFCLVTKFTDAIRGSWTAAAPAKAAKGGKGDKKGKEAKKEAKPADDDDMDLFGDDNEEDAAAAKEVADKAKKAKEGKKEKKVVIAQSLVLFEIKPLDDTTDLDTLAARVLAINMDGLYWKTEYKKVPVAYGIFKIIIGVTLEDDKVGVDDLQEQIEAFDDMVQSVEILAFNKI